MSERIYSDSSLYRRILIQARPYWPHIAVVFLLDLMTTGFALLTPIPIKIIIDSFIGSHPLPEFVDVLLPSSATSSSIAILVTAVVFFLLLRLIQELRSLSSSILRTFTSQKLSLDFRARLVRHAQRLSFSFHDSRGTADSIYRIHNDTQSVHRIAIDGIIPFVTSAFMIGSMLYFILQFNLQLGLIALAVAPVLFILSRTYRIFPLFPLLIFVWISYI